MRYVLLTAMFLGTAAALSASIKDVVQRPLDPRSGTVKVIYSVECGEDEAPETLGVTVVDRERSRILAQVTVRGDIDPGEPLTPGRHVLLWNALRDCPARPVSAMEVRLSAVKAAQPLEQEAAGKDDSEAEPSDSEGKIPVVAFTEQPPSSSQPVPEPIFLVIDLAGGPEAAKYPHAILHGVPEGGWTDEYKTTKLVLRYIEPGTFLMGSPMGEFRRDFNEDQHLVTLTKPYFIGVFEVTQKQWELVTGKNPSRYQGAMRPVEQISYDMIRGAEVGRSWPENPAVDSTSFIGLLRIRSGIETLDIPTEAEWEYACRAGTTTPFNNGTSPVRVDLDPNMMLLGRCSSNWNDGHGGYSEAHTTVGSYEPNAWGLYDMHGNVWEFCRDWYIEKFGSMPQVDPVGPKQSSTRAGLRGGCYQVGADLCRAAIRCRGAFPHNFDEYSGLRVTAGTSDADDWKK